MMMQMLGQMVRMPVSMFTWWMDALASTMRAVQQPGWQDPDTANRYASALRTRVPGTGMHLDNSSNQYGTAPGTRFP
ncbi:MAG TPA: hypothetical protein VFC23_12650, partial [Thermoanaerobaculia bacterium]|nr:hypothetical protein [Thermoanaerobaculia bacterium]